MELLAVQVAPAAEVEQRVHPGAAERYLDQALAPRPPERVGDDDREIDREARDQALAQRGRGRVGVAGQQREHARSEPVRLVDPGVGADPSVPRLTITWPRSIRTMRVASRSTTS